MFSYQRFDAAGNPKIASNSAPFARHGYWLLATPFARFDNPQRAQQFCAIWGVSGVATIIEQLTPRRLARYDAKSGDIQQLTSSYSDARMRLRASGEIGKRFELRLRARACNRRERMVRALAAWITIRLARAEAYGDEATATRRR